MDSLLVWGVKIIQCIQACGNPTLDAVFKGITFIGDERFYLLLIPLLYWAIDKALAMRLAFIYLGSAYVNTLLKAIFAVARPSSTVVRVISPAEGYAFPSGHSQMTSTVWGYLATQAHRAWFWVIASAIIVLVALSRVYLGVHYPQDVIAGLLIAIVLVGCYNWFLKSYGVQIKGLSLATKLGLACVVPLLLLALHAEKDTVSSMSTLLGLGIGMTLEQEFVRFSCAGSLTRRVMRFVIGLIVLLTLYLGLKIVFPIGLLFRGVRYALVGLWASLGAPWLFMRLELDEAE